MLLFKSIPEGDTTTVHFPLSTVNWREAVKFRFIGLADMHYFKNHREDFCRMQWNPRVLPKSYCLFVKEWYNRVYLYSVSWGKHYGFFQSDLFVRVFLPVASGVRAVPDPAGPEYGAADFLPDFLRLG